MWIILLIVGGTFFHERVDDLALRDLIPVLHRQRIRKQWGSLEYSGCLERWVAMLSVSWLALARILQFIILRQTLKLSCDISIPSNH